MDSKKNDADLFGPFSDTQINSDMSSKEAYFELLRAWINQANISQSAMACFPYYLMANYPQLFQSQIQNGLGGITGGSFPRPNVPGVDIGGGVVGGGAVGGDAGPTPAAAATPAHHNGGVHGVHRVRDRDARIADLFDNEARHQEIINQNGGYEYVIAPFWKRMLAELVDVAILLLLKLMMLFTLIDYFDLDLGFNFDLESLKKSLEDDYTELISFSSDFLLIEIIIKLIVCAYEFFWTMNEHAYFGGATPGKILMGLRIVHVDAVVPLPPVPINMGNNGTRFRALLFPASNLGFRQALSRAIAKNMIMALLFPMCFIMLFFKNNRTAYDILTKTIVVEENHAPILRRPAVVVR